MGMLCIWLVFSIGKFWFNETVGYLAAAFVATIQYTVMYSQIARPYISGLFFSLMMVWCWSNYFFNEKRKRIQLAGYILFAVLCCYDHYFSLLFAAIVGITGLFFLDKKNWKEYLVANAIVVLLFLPHLSITFNQLNIGGVGGWLSKPDSSFFQHYLDYIFEFSWWVKGTVIALIILSFIFLDKKSRGKDKFRIIALLWFLLPYFIGYFYSVYRNPVLQYSVLIFSFPFLLFFIFSFFRTLKAAANFLLILIVMSTSCYALIFERKHYEIFYKQPIEQFAKNSIRIVDELK